MKTTKLFTLALGALLLAGCSSDAIDDPGNGSGGDSNTAGKGYISLSINLPTRTQTTATARAANSKNYQYDDGTIEEYKVNDAYLLIFKKGTATKEADYTFSSAYKLGDAFTNVGEQTDAITTHGETVVKVNENMASSANLYGLVVLNGNDILTESNNAYKIKGMDITAETNKETKFGDFMKATAQSTTTDMKASDFTTKGFFMTNAVLVNKSGAATGGVVSNSDLADDLNVQTLVPLKDKIKATESDTKGNATEFFVERAVAKVDVTGTGITSGIKDVNGTTLSDSKTVGVTIEGWDLGNTNTKTYVVRNWGMVDTPSSSDTPDYTGNAGNDWFLLTSSAYPTSDENSTNPYRFAGTVKQQVNGKPSEEWYRTYFGYDPNFTEEKTDLSTVTSISNDNKTKYCLENTFDVAHQQIQYTTCAIIKVKLSLPTDDSYSWTTDGSSTTSQVFYTIGMGGNGKGTIYDYKGMCNVLSKYAIDKYESELTSKLASGKSLENDYTPTYTFADVENGVKKLSNIVWAQKTDNSNTNNNSENTSEIKLSDITGAIDAINTNRPVSQYADACTYYRVPIKHFGDDLTPWSRYTDDKETGTTKGASYPSNDPKNYLGRYGVLRNNWYTLEVTEVKQIGSPTVPDITKDDTWDDEFESYIAVNCNVLSWAKRVQGVILK